jgi:thiol-disulfide isomerase/thioredoxin
MKNLKIIKINSLGCPSCIIMNNIFNKIKYEYAFEYEDLDYDFDYEDIEKYNIGNILPVFIFLKDNVEINRLCGEHKIEEFKEIIEGNFNEKGN